MSTGLIQTPDIGRIVRVVIVNRHGEHVIRPAQIVSVDGDRINAVVTLDGHNDRREGLLHCHECGLRYDGANPQPGTWHWPGDLEDGEVAIADREAEDALEAQELHRTVWVGAENLTFESATEESILEISIGDVVDSGNVRGAILRELRPDTDELVFQWEGSEDQVTVKASALAEFLGPSPVIRDRMVAVRDGGPYDATTPLGGSLAMTMEKVAAFAEEYAEEAKVRLDLAGVTDERITVAVPQGHQLVAIGVEAKHIATGERRHMGCQILQQDVGDRSGDLDGLRTWVYQQVDDLVQRWNNHGEAPDIDPVAIAKLCHEANRAYCQSIGDDSQVPWDEAPQWQKDSAEAGVRAIIHNPVMHPRESHEEWLAMKRDTGWTYGETKDPEAKTHPCMVPYEDLPEQQRMKDWIFISTARKALAEHMEIPEWPHGRFNATSGESEPIDKDKVREYEAIIEVLMPLPHIGEVRAKNLAYEHGITSPADLWEKGATWLSETIDGISLEMAAEVMAACDPETESPADAEG